MNTTPDDEKIYRDARKRVKRKKSFYSTIISYFIVSSFLTLINWYTQHDEETINWWVLWVWSGWGIGLCFYAASFYKKNILFSDEWEQQKIKEEIEKMKLK